MHFALKLHGGLGDSGWLDDATGDFGHARDGELVVPGLESGRVHVLTSGITSVVLGRLDVGWVKEERGEGLRGHIPDELSGVSCVDDGVLASLLAGGSVSGICERMSLLQKRDPERCQQEHWGIMGRRFLLDRLMAYEEDSWRIK